MAQIHTAAAIKVLQDLVKTELFLGDHPRRQEAFEHARKFLESATQPLTEHERSLSEKARDKYFTDDIEIDDPLHPADFSHADDGSWVRAWVWIPDEE